MAQVPKIYAPTPAQSVAAARGMPVSKVASLNASIDETAAGNPSAFDTEFILHEDLRRDAAADRNRQQNLPQHRTRFAVPSQQFTSLVEQFSGTVDNDVDPNVRSRQIGGIVTKAIKTYETNSKIIHGNPDVTGTELSIRL